MLRLMLIRGLPGSGKSTLAREMAEKGFVHVEADQYFESKDGYVFKPEQLKAAHLYCQSRAERALGDGRNVVVANTFTRRWEMDAYIEMARAYGASLEIVTATGNYGNVHGVSQDKIDAMRARWEP